MRDLLKRYAPRTAPAGDRPKLADLGCGGAMLLAELRESYDGIGVDSSPHAIELAAERGVSVRPGTLPGDIPLAEKSFDVVLMMDVLEHLDDDAASLATACGLLKPGGILLCTVPAHRWLWSKRDDAHHHRRRYGRAALRGMFAGLPLEVTLISHFNMWLFPMAAVSRMLGLSAMEMKVPPAPINQMMEAIMASERALIGRVFVPWGLSFVAVARRIERSA